MGKKVTVHITDLIIISCHSIGFPQYSVLVLRTSAFLSFDFLFVNQGRFLNLNLHYDQNFGAELSNGRVTNNNMLFIFIGIIS